MKLSLFKALLLIGISTLLINGTAYLGLKGYFSWKKRAELLSNTYIQTIVQTGPQKEALTTTYLSELLGLSQDHPLKVEEIDLKKAEQKLRSSPVIKEAEVKILKLGALYIDYTVRVPAAMLYDFENMAIDEEGVVFPLTPFFSPKNLPEIYLGLSFSEMKRHLEGAKIELAFEILKLVSEPIVKDFIHLRRIDVSKAFEKSYGQQEVVLILEDEILSKTEGKEIHYFLPQYLRLTRKNFAKELGNYLKLREELLKKVESQLQLPLNQETVVRLKSKIIDLRLDQLAFIK